MFQSSDTAEEIMSLQNHIAELEDEKGNLQLRLVELDDALNAQGNFESPPGKHLPIIIIKKNACALKTPRIVALPFIYGVECIITPHCLCLPH